MPIEFTDRYLATGTPYPDPNTSCDECEGMGCYPVHRNTEDANDRILWEKADAERRNLRGLLRLLWQNKKWWLWKQVWCDLWRYGLRNWGCDDWHFISCPACKGTRKG